MNIVYEDTHDFISEQLEDLFLSVEWSSGHYPDKLVTAMKNFETVFSAWEGERLVGMICAMDDGIMTAYVHYLLVNPEYQGRHIGRELVGMVREKYADYLRIVVVAYNAELDFYEKCGFKKSDDSSPMFITSLWT
ncbi:MAG: GNAT family N-acetyltransferase [Ruminococcus sp.]|nr:GNAT family N-acetyltransferase [Ruminococcus sp.]MDE7137232.1 GNAT family N-acetyltransferase [Ruminococcus sp.]